MFPVSAEYLYSLFATGCFLSLHVPRSCRATHSIACIDAGQVIVLADNRLN